MERGIGKGDAIATARLKMRAATSAATLGRPEEMAPLLNAAEPVFRTDPNKYRFELVDLNMARAQLLRRSNKLDEAIALIEKTLPDAEIAYAGKDRDLLLTYNNLLVYMIEANKLDAMPAVFARADAFSQKTDQQNTMTGLAITQLKALRLVKLDQPAPAVKILEEVVARRRSLFGSSAGLAVDLIQLGRAQIALGNFAKAQPILTEAYALSEKYLTVNAIPTFVSGAALAESQAETGNIAAANNTIARLERSLPPTPPSGFPHAIVSRAKVIALLNAGKISQAKAEADNAEKIFKAQGPAAETFLKTFPALRARIAKGS